MRTARGRGVGTPDLAEQAGVLPNCQRQHDRKESCSRHVMLATHKGKSRASQKRRVPQEILTFSKSRPRRPNGPAEFRRSVRKIPSAIALLGTNSARWLPCAVASHVLTRCSVRYKETTYGTSPS
jgi:hypothetical protein